MNIVHKQNWNEIIRLLKSDLYSDIHKFYYKPGGWAYLTDKYGNRHEISIGNTVQYFKTICENIRSANNYIPHGRRAYRYRTAPPLSNLNN